MDTNTKLKLFVVGVAGTVAIFGFSTLSLAKRTVEEPVKTIETVASLRSEQAVFEQEIIDTEPVRQKLADDLKAKEDHIKDLKDKTAEKETKIQALLNPTKEEVKK